MTRVPEATTQLAYESRIAGALRTDEVVLWERRPTAPQSIPVIAGSIAIILIVAGAAALGWAVSGDPVAIVASTVIAAIVMLVVAASTLNEALSRRRKISRSTYRITNHRVVRVDERPGKPCEEVFALDVTGFELLRRERGRGMVLRCFGDMEMPAVELPGIEPDDAVESHMMSQWRGAARRPQLRRVRDRNAPMPSPTDSPVPPWLTLGADELLLWSARPLPWKLTGKFVIQKLMLLVTLTIPALIMLAAADAFAPFIGDVPGWLIIGAGVWLLIGGNALLVHPIREARRLARTTYALTNVRAIIHEASRNPRTRSYLLDMANDAELVEHGDGSGDVRVMIGASFERITDAHRVYLMMLDAIRAAGSPREAVAPAPPIVSPVARE